MSATVDITPMLEALWPPGEAGRTEVYAVLDGARDRRIEHLLTLWALQHECLYGAVGPELRNAAPFLVKLERDAPGTLELLRESAGQDWGIFAVAPEGTGMPTVLAHLRRLQHTLLPDGRVALLRYFDPRVLRVLVQCCEPAEIAQLAGPLRMLIHETEAVRIARVPAAGEAVRRGVLRIRPSMMAALEAAALRAMASDLAPGIAGRLAAPLARQGVAAETTEGFVTAALQRAWGSGIRVREDLEDYVELAATLGIGFAEDVSLPWAGEILRDGVLTGTDKIALLFEQVIFRGLAA